jgi:uncharacterized protein YcfL
VKKATLVLLLLLGLCGCQSEQERRAEFERKAKIEADRSALVESCKGQRLISVVNTGRQVAFKFDNGKVIVVHSCAHHSAGSHCEIWGQ